MVRVRVRVRLRLRLRPRLRPRPRLRLRLRLRPRLRLRLRLRVRVLSPSSSPALIAASAALLSPCWERQCRSRSLPGYSRRRARASSSRMICSALRFEYTRRTCPAGGVRDGT